MQPGGKPEGFPPENPDNPRQVTESPEQLPLAPTPQLFEEMKGVDSASFPDVSNVSDDRDLDSIDFSRSKASCGNSKAIQEGFVTASPVSANPLAEGSLVEMKNLETPISMPKAKDYIHPRSPSSESEPPTGAPTQDTRTDVCDASDTSEANGRSAALPSGAFIDSVTEGAQLRLCPIAVPCLPCFLKASAVYSEERKMNMIPGNLDLRNFTTEARRQLPENIGASGIRMAGVQQFPREPAASYIITGSDREKCWAVGIEDELEGGNHRPDLHILFFGSYSTDLANPDRPFNVDNYAKGDCLFVTEATLAPGRRIEDLMTSTENVHDVASHNESWRIKKCYLVKRGPLSEVFELEPEENQSNSSDSDHPADDAPIEHSDPADVHREASHMAPHSFFETSRAIQGGLATASPVSANLSAEDSLTEKDNFKEPVTMPAEKESPHPRGKPAHDVPRPTEGLGPNGNDTDDSSDDEWRQMSAAYRDLSRVVAPCLGCLYKFSNCYSNGTLQVLPEWHDLRNYTNEAVRNRPEILGPSGVRMAGVEQEPPEGGARHVMWGSDKKKSWAINIEKGLNGDHVRPDLHIVFFGSYSKDLANPERVFNVDNYAKSDLLYVTKTRINPAYRYEDRLTRPMEMHDAANHKEFWQVTEFYLGRRGPLSGLVGPGVQETQPNPDDVKEMERVQISARRSRPSARKRRARARRRAAEGQAGPSN